MPQAGLVLAFPVLAARSKAVPGEAPATYQLVLEPEEVGAVVVAVPQHQRGVALLQVAPCQRNQGPDLGRRSRWSPRRRALEPAAFLPPPRPLRRSPALPCPQPQQG